MNSSTATENYHSDSTDNTAETIALLRLQYHCHLLSNFNVTREASKIVLRFVICFNNNAEILKIPVKSLTCILKSEGSKHDFWAQNFYFFPFLIIPRTINFKCLLKIWKSFIELHVQARYRVWNHLLWKQS